MSFLPFQIIPFYCLAVPYRQATADWELHLFSIYQDSHVKWLSWYTAERTEHPWGMMHPGWQGVFPQKELWEQFRAPMSGSCSEPSSEETSPCSQTRKEKLAGEVGSLGLHGMTIPISFFKTGGSGKSTFKIKTAAAFTLLIIPRGTASDFAGAGGLVCAGISFPDKDNVWIVEITRQDSAAGWEGAQMEGGPGQERLPGRRDRGPPGPARRGRLQAGESCVLGLLVAGGSPGSGSWAALSCGAPAAALEGLLGRQARGSPGAGRPQGLAWGCLAAGLVRKAASSGTSLLWQRSARRPPRQHERRNQCFLSASGLRQRFLARAAALGSTSAALTLGQGQGVSVGSWPGPEAVE